ncbi:MAG TPA: TonB-dependent receptor, partial [Rhodanobacteraceae bacterium]|nr:TonB-dependent receptor [Rhodanobacteraceae bacterium]
MGLGMWGGAICAQPQEQDLGNLSLEDLGKVVVTSVAKSPEPLSDAPASVYVITHDQIVRSGAMSLPEILRLAPNLEVFRTSPSGYVITARGFSGNSAAQNFPDKLLVLIDGRSVYNPLFSGIYWDQQYVLPENIDRIEVISGPAGALWGANAVNGVINIITRRSLDTQGGLVEIGTGDSISSALVQYGGQFGGHAHYRVYASDFHQRSFDDSNGADAHDDWSKPQVGFRIDWDFGADLLTLQGDVNNGRVGQPDATDLRIAETDVQASWQRWFRDGSNFQLRTYYDNVRRWNDASGGGFSLDTYDVKAQHDFALGDRQQVIWGIGDRVYHYDITPRISDINSLLWDPASSTQNLANAFVQDQITLGRRTELTLGLKAEHDPYSGLSWMPSVRVAWKASDTALLWASASRAVRTPTPFDEDVIEKLGSMVFLTGNPDFRRERLTAWEAGFRDHWSDRARLSVSLYYNAYDDLKTIEFSPTVLPLLWGNGMEGHTLGV